MRGVVAGGMVSALESRGLLPCFDSLHGSSVGACAGAFFLAGQARLGTRIFYEDINNRSFIDPRRVLAGRPIMNTDFLINHVMRVSKPLQVGEILSHPGVLHIITTDALSGGEHEFDRFRNVEHFFSILQATITMPVLAGPAIEVENLHLVDGGMVQQIALESALGIGATHILILMTRKEGNLQRQNRAFDFLVGNILIQLMYSNALASLYVRRSANINRTLARISSLHSDGAVAVDTVVRGVNSCEVGRLTTDSELLKVADLEGQQAIFRYLG